MAGSHDPAVLRVGFGPTARDCRGCSLAGSTVVREAACDKLATWSIVVGEPCSFDAVATYAIGVGDRA